MPAEVFQSIAIEHHMLAINPTPSYRYHNLNFLTCMRGMMREAG